MRDDRIKRWLILIFLLILFIVFFRLVSNSRWDGHSRLSLVLSVDNPDLSGLRSLVLFSIEPRTNRAVYLVVPGNTLLTVPFGYRDYLAASVYKLGQLDKIRGGGQLLAKSIENTLGILINGYLVSPNQSFPFVIDDEMNLKTLKSGKFSFYGLFWNFTSVIFSLNSLDTDFGLYDRIKLWWEVRKLRTDQIDFYDLASLQFMDEAVQADGSVIKKINTDLFDTKLGNIWEDSEIRRENVTLEIVNATEQEKVAGSFSDILNHLGATVILTSTDKTLQKEKCQIYLLNPLAGTSKVVKILQKNYNCSILNKYFDSIQSDVRIVLGEDYLK